MLNQLKDVYASLDRHDVRYLVIGGIAAVLHGVPRATFDLDILIEPSADNAMRLLAAFTDSGLGTATLTTAEDLLAHEVTIFRDWIRIDVQTRTPGLDFAAAWARKETKEYQGQKFYLLALDDLISSKRAAGRPVDLEDVRLLELTKPTA